MVTLKAWPRGLIGGTPISATAVFVGLQGISPRKGRCEDRGHDRGQLASPVGARFECEEDVLKRSKHALRGGEVCHRNKA